MTKTYRFEFTEAELRLLEDAVAQYLYLFKDVFPDEAPAFHALQRRLFLRQEVV